MNADEIRRKIADCDLKIVELISERNGLAAEMGNIKKKTGSPIRVPEVEEIVRNRYVSNGTVKGISGATLEKIATVLIDESVRIQSNIINNDNQTRVQRCTGRKFVSKE